MLLVEQRHVRNPLFGHFAVREPSCPWQQTQRLQLPSLTAAPSRMTEHQVSPSISALVFSLADKCSRNNHGRWAGVRHPAQHHRQTALWPGRPTTAAASVCPQLNVCVVCVDSEDHRTEGDLVLWAPVQGQQRFLHLAQTQQEGEECVHAFWTKRKPF